MPDINRAVDQSSIINDLTRRVRALETSQRAAASAFTVESLLPGALRPVTYGGSIPSFTADAELRASGTPVTIPPVTVQGRSVLIIQSIATQWYGTASIYKGISIFTALEFDGIGTYETYRTVPIASAEDEVTVTIADVYDMHETGNAALTEHSVQFKWHVVGDDGNTTETALNRVVLIAIPLAFQ